MLQFIAGLAVGGIIAIFVYRNNQRKISKYADKIDQIWDKLEESQKNNINKKP